jgi:hypothetical protein
MTLMERYGIIWLSEAIVLAHRVGGRDCAAKWSATIKDCLLDCKTKKARRYMAREIMLQIAQCKPKPKL